jgi:hypothetical protein
VVEFASQSDTLRINFKLFPRQCQADVFARVPAGVMVLK